MDLHLYDTATRSQRRFVPLEPGQVRIYVCGATVQSAPHIGHVRSGVAFDVLNRWLQALGYQVTLCRNVTDIDDKILTKAIEEDRPWWAVASDYERQFTEAYRSLGCLAPTVEPRATGHIPQMINLIDRLITAGHAYAVSGDVYFDVRSFARYGQLSGQKIEHMQSADHAGDKRDPLDFALWKASKPGEPAWDTPWGPGRPGWHIECSAMATTYLGAEFDIHGGGRDLEFPHHENELAQSQAAGDGFAAYWLHNGWVTTAGEKMSKSLGNSLLVTEMVQKVRPIELRWYLAAAHYRSTLEFSPQALQESATGFRRLESFVLRAHELTDGVEGLPQSAQSAQSAQGSSGSGMPVSIPTAFAAAMNDDLNVPAAIAVIHETVTFGNQAIADGALTAVANAACEVRAMLAVLGADPLADQWQSAGPAGDKSLATALDTLVQYFLDKRAAARAAKDFATADAIRADLLAAGIHIEDGAAGSRWSVQEHR